MASFEEYLKERRGMKMIINTRDIPPDLRTEYDSVNGQAWIKLRDGGNDRWVPMETRGSDGLGKVAAPWDEHKHWMEPWMKGFGIPGSLER